MRACNATTRKGEPCPIGAEESGPCHVHDPNGKYQRQRRGELAKPRGSYEPTIADLRVYREYHDPILG